MNVSNSENPTSSALSNSAEALHQSNNGPLCAALDTAPPPGAQSQDDPLPLVPQDLKELRSWLLWSYVPNREGETCKHPDESLRHIEEQVTDPEFAAELKAIGVSTRRGLFCMVCKHRCDTKLPINAKSGTLASVTNSVTWSSYQEACAGAKKFQNDGLGIVVQAPLIAIDLDKCIDANGKHELWAFVTAMSAGTYAEISPSCHGYHVFLNAENPIKEFLADGRMNSRCARVEIFGGDHYITVTGEKLDRAPSTIRTTNVNYKAVLAADPAPQAAKRKRKAAAKAVGTAPTAPEPELYEILVRVDPCELAEHFPPSGKGPFDHSRADFELCRILARKHDCDPELIEEEFNQTCPAA